MSTLPDLIGFSVTVGVPYPGPAERTPLAVTGHQVPVQADGVTGMAIASDGAVLDPLVTDGEVTLLFAGEFYNRHRLARAVGAVNGDNISDAELVLAGLRRYGLSVFRLLNGRFAALVVTARRIAAAADHAGSVPLYLRLAPDRVQVSTEAKALHACTTVVDHIPGTASVPGTAGPRRIRAGHVVVIDRTADAATAHAWRTWAPTYGRQLVEPRAAVAAVAARLDAAVRDRSGGSAVTVVLSGGIDSSGVAALAAGRATPVATVTLGTDAGDEFEAARLVARHLGTEHVEMTMPAVDLVAELPRAVAAAEIVDPEVLEYLLPLVALYRRLPGAPRRVLTGYGADIPLGGMHRTTEPLELLDGVIAADMDSFDGLNELSPVLSGVAGHWSTHPYWDREVLDLLVGLEPGLKRRHGRDKWVLREALADRLPVETVRRPKLGIHEGSGLTSAWTLMLREAGVAAAAVPGAKRTMARRLYEAVVLGGVAPGEVSVFDVMAAVVREEAAR